jgi:hypothetical protein
MGRVQSKGNSSGKTVSEERDIMPPSSLMATTRTFSVFVMLALVASAVESHAADKAIRLEIPDTGQEKRRPESGWCGEAAIQMAMSYYGAYASQQAINRAGKPLHPDLYSNEIPEAMTNLGLEFKAWQGEGLPAFLRWVRGELRAGHPVLLGVKIYPTSHPEWNLDHFVLAVGCTEDCLTYNTTWKRAETRSLALLSSTEKGLSIANRYDSYYGLAITGIKANSAAVNRKPTRIRIGQGRDKEVELHVTAENLEPGKRYRLLKFTALATVEQSAIQGELVRSFVADGPKMELVEKIGLDEERLYRCLPSSN